MRNLPVIALCLCLLSPFACEGQSRRTTTPASIRMEMRQGEYIDHKIELWRKDEILRYKKLSEGRYFLFNSDESFIYLGAILSESRPVPHGKGISRTLKRDKSGRALSEYSLCPWKRGSRHGEGFLARPDGDCCKTVWKWNKQRRDISAELSPEEKELLDKEIQDLELAAECFFIPQLLK